MANEFNIGDKVYWFDAWDTLRCGHIISIGEQHGIGAVAKIRYIEGGESGASLDKLFISQEACLAAHAADINRQIEDYKSEITDVKSLVSFMLTHGICSNPECGDYEARQAARQKAEELLDIKTEY